MLEELGVKQSCPRAPLGEGIRRKSEREGGRKRPSEEWCLLVPSAVVVVEFGGAFLGNKAEGQRHERVERERESRRSVEVTAAHGVLDKPAGQ